MSAKKHVYAAVEFFSPQCRATPRVEKHRLLMHCSTAGEIISQCITTTSEAVSAK